MTLKAVLGWLGWTCSQRRARTPGGLL